MLKKLSLAIAMTVTVFASPVFAMDRCADGKTLTEGKLTIATGNPAYYPWVHDDAPETGKGFEAAELHQHRRDDKPDNGSVQKQEEVAIWVHKWCKVTGS